MNKADIKWSFLRIASLCRLALASRRINLARRRGDTILSFGPSSLNLMMADTCNSQCIMCGHDYRGCGSKQALSLENIKTIYSHLNMRQVVDVIYGGGGEPFLNPELADIGEYTFRHYPVIQHTVITNMIAHKPDVAARLLRSRVHFVISVNAASPGTFQEVSSLDCFEEVIEHIRSVVKLRSDLASRANISLSMILMKANIGELCDFIRLAVDLGVDGVKTLYVRVYPGSYRAKRNREEKIQPEDSLFYHREESDETVLKAENLAKSLHLSFEHEPLFCRSSARERDCCESWKSLFINFNGDVYPCPASEILFKRKIDSGQYGSGNVLKQDVSEFWNNSFWQALRKTNATSAHEEIVPECSCCGNSINWWGPDCQAAHVLDWDAAEESDLRI